MLSGNDVRSRRRILAVALGAVGAAIAQTLGRPTVAQAADGDPVVAGEIVTASTTTQIHVSGIYGALAVQADGAGADAFAAVNTGGGGGGVYGQSSGTNSSGVRGFSDIGIGIQGGSTTGTGVYGFGPNGVSVGVHGQAYNGTGVLAQAGSDGTALKVMGRAAFSQSGRATIAAGASSVSRSVAGATASSLVFAVVQTGDASTWVRKVAPGNGKFTVLLNKTVSIPTTVAWIVLG